MKTYQDLVAVGLNEKSRAAFVRTAVEEFRGSAEYREAQAGEAYYNKHNLTIERFQKMLYTISGRRVPDLFSASYKLKTLFFRRFVIQQVQYVLGNGCTFREDDTKEKLGTDFDFKLQTAAKRAMAGGQSFGFWNYDHMEVMGFADTPAEPGFCPLYDENTAKLAAGIRFYFKKVGDKKHFHATLYEADGMTDYVQVDKADCVPVSEKTAYKTTERMTAAGGVEERRGENYGVLPIVPLYANDSRESELNGIRECIDAYDYIKSGLANDIDDTSGFYWVLKNSGGMDDTDLAQFLQRMKTVRAAVVDADAGQEAEAHTLEVPTEARRTMLEMLRADLYEDFQALDVKSLSAAAKTTQEIQAAYQAQDNKCADFEYFVIDFVQQILAIAGIDDSPSFVWNRIVNMAEQTNMILSAATYLDEDTVVKKLPFLTPEEAEEVLARRTAEDVGQFGLTGSEDDE